MHRGTVFTFSPGSFYSHSRQRKMSCEFPWKDLTFLVRENSVTSIESWNFIISVFLTVIMQESIIHSNKPIAFKKKMIPHATYCFVFFHDFDWHSEVHLSIMPSRQSCVTLLPLATSDSSSTSCEETIWVRVHIIIPPTIIACIACICIGTLLDERVVNEQFPPAKMCLTFGSSAESGTE